MNETPGSLQPSTVADLADLIDYQDGAVVSRTLVDKEATTVTLFAFDKGQGLSEHTTPFDALVYVVDGESEINVGGTAHTVKAGQVLLMPADIPHAVRAVERFKMLLIMARA